MVVVIKEYSADDYETQLTRQDEERDAQEQAAYALSKAHAGAQDQQSPLSVNSTAAEKTTFLSVLLGNLPDLLRGSSIGLIRGKIYCIKD